MNKYRCAECGDISNTWDFFKTNREYKGVGYDFDLEVEVPCCKKCGSPIYNKEIEEKIREKVNEIIRKETNIISKEEILFLLDYYNVSQKFLSKVLGWGEATLPRYIKGSYSPSIENSARLKSIRNPYILLSMVEQNLEEEDDPLREKLIKNINRQIELQEEKVSKIIKVVDWFLCNSSDEDEITHLALQKALYFVQAWSYVFNQTWLFTDECEAWVHGAVYREVYKRFKAFRYSPLPHLNTEISLTEEEIQVLRFVKKYYLDVYSAKTLEKICHLEDPFKEARTGLSEFERSDYRIAKDKISTYYTVIAKKYDISEKKLNNIKLYLNDLLFA